MEETVEGWGEEEVEVVDWVVVNCDGVREA
jgi:hypothetical protein